MAVGFGPFITELVYFLPYLRTLDDFFWDRGDYHRLSAIELYYRRRFRYSLPFSVFVMGHTHKAELSVIEIYEKPGEIPSSFCLHCLPHDSKIYQRYKR